MNFTPITKAEARGDSVPMRLACLDRLAARGAALLRNAQRHTRPQDGPSGASLLALWFATREPHGGATVDLGTGQTVSRDHGWAVATGDNGYHRSVSPGAEYGEFIMAVLTVSVHTPQGQYLGVFYDVDENRIDIDSVYLTDSRDEAIAVGVASHSTGGAYDFATGNAVWMPHLREG